MLLDRYAELSTDSDPYNPGLHTCKIWTYDNVLPENKIPVFRHFLDQVMRGTRTNIEGRQFTINGQTVKLAGTAERHNYIKIWTVFDCPEYYYQTQDTVYDWYRNQIKKDIEPALRYLVEAIENQVEVCKQIGPVICMRFFINYFPAPECMQPHTDGEKFLYNLDLEQGDLWSATYYLQVPKEGGELWFPGHDFEYKPKVNSLAIFNGNKFLHGVKGVPEGDLDRISITVRYAAVKDLVLPGDPDKFLYKPNFVAQAQ